MDNICKHNLGFIKESSSMLKTYRKTFSFAKQSISFDFKSHYTDYKKVNIFVSNINISIMSCYGNCNSASGRQLKQTLLKN